MKNISILSFLFLSRIAFSQDSYANCSAVFLNNEMIVDEYSAKAKCRISKEAKGWISVGTVNLGDVSLGEDKFKITKKINFAIAIKDAKTGTITLFSSKIFKKIAAETVLNKCQKGDSIMILTTDDEYSLPHNDLLVQ